MTKAQRGALLWLRNRNGDGLFDRGRGGVVLAAGEHAPVMRATWNALEAQGLVEFYANRRRIRVTPQGGALDLTGVAEASSC